MWASSSQYVCAWAEFSRSRDGFLKGFLRVNLANHLVLTSIHYLGLVPRWHGLVGLSPTYLVPNINCL